MADVMHKDTTATKLNSINYSPKKKIRIWS